MKFREHESALKGRTPSSRRKFHSRVAATAPSGSGGGGDAARETSEHPLRRRESTLVKKGYKIVVGVDEAGRGPLAGPVVAASCSIPVNLDLGDSVNIGDSKQLSETEREIAYEAITTNPNIKWSASIVDEKVIDEINILQATFRAVRFPPCAAPLAAVG